MIEIKLAEEGNAEIIALLGRITYTESHGQFIDNQNDLLSYNNEAFSIAKTRVDLKNPKNLFYIIYSDNLPVGYAKLVLNAQNESVLSQNTCLLERIYILNDFIPLKIGQRFLTFLEDKAKEQNLDTMWLTVYIKNYRAIRFYQKNEYKNVGELNFNVNGEEYENTIFSKKI